MKVWVETDGVWAYRLHSRNTHPQSYTTYAYIGHNADSLAYFGMVFSPTDSQAHIWLKNYANLEELKQVIETTVELME